MEEEKGEEAELEPRTLKGAEEKTEARREAVRREKEGEEEEDEDEDEEEEEGVAGDPPCAEGGGCGAGGAGWGAGEK